MQCGIVGIVFSLSIFAFGVNCYANLNTDNFSPKALRLMARVYMAHGDYDKAQPLLEKSLYLAKAQNTLDEELCYSLLDTAWLYQNQSN